MRNTVFYLSKQSVVHGMLLKVAIMQYNVDPRGPGIGFDDIVTFVGIVENQLVLVVWNMKIQGLVVTLGNTVCRAIWF